MRGVLQAAQRLHDVVRWLQWLVVFASSMLIVALICTIVVLRYVFEMDLYGMEELAVFVGIWLFFIGASYASQRGEQISADVVPQYLRSQVARGALELLTTVVSLGVCVLAAYWAWDWLSWGLERPARSPVHGIPMTVTHAAVLASFVLMSVFTLRDVVVRARELVKLVAPRQPRQ